ncbi:T9SS type A sorting domain-containing protein [Seonamhaeicola sediminis]|uniref:T9SS type A sorting domain-containing protein n=1 Tax=Seonamhaeicola sediminis TaxID=2528206 RepID=A0A562YE34_9FLAO|nr:choice-of-anchor J domain-containing protein [Seonamhaeicola sediminis]TWO32875.1 T9SS type A sorting domain-containing protein [Seonamhaeicola sediminis]
MKKITFILLILCFSLNSKAQCDSNLPVMEHFDTNTINVCWNIVDGDGDGWDWYWRDYGSVYGGYKCLVSRSWNSSQGDLYPDNWVYSYAIDLTSYSTSETIELTWKVRGELATVAHEYYTVYAATGNQITDFESSSVQLSEYADEVGADGVFVTRNLDISALAGNMIYIAFRHQNISGSQFILNIDDVSISNSSLGVDDLQINNFKHFYNISTKELTLKSDSIPIDNIALFNIIGQNVLNKTLSQTEEKIDLSNLNKGIYIGQVKLDNVIKTIKFVKQ